MSDDQYDNPLTVKIPPESRILYVLREDRVMEILPEDRTHRVELEER